MSGARIGRRLAALERRGGGAGGRCLKVILQKSGSADADGEAALTEAKRTATFGTDFILVRFVAPGSVKP